MVCALCFTRRGVKFASRFVQGRKFIREQQCGQPLYRAFGTSFPGDRLRRGIATESPFNVSVFAYADKLLAFGEQSLPMELDPVTLETRTPGRTFDFDGILNDAAPFSAHPKIDARTGELLNFGIFFAPDQPLLIYYRFDTTGRLACRSRVPIDLPCSLHDFAASDNYVIFYLSPYVLDPTGLTERGLATIDSLSWQPECGSQLLILCRETGTEIARIPIEGRYCLHTINAFERDNRLVIDLIEFERPIYDQYEQLPDLFVDVPFGQPVRFHVDLATRLIFQKTSINYCCAPDFPAIDPRRESQPYDDVWMLGISATGQQGRKFFDCLVHAKWSQPDKFDIWSCPRGHYLGGEPVFVGDPSDINTGVIICHLFDAATPASHFAMFDANDIAAGPVAFVSLESPVHLGFHALFLPQGQ
jgi:carotenoid cleavage dioxygenase